MLVYALKGLAENETGSILPAMDLAGRMLFYPVVFFLLKTKKEIKS